MPRTAFSASIQTAKDLFSPRPARPTIAFLIIVGPITEKRLAPLTYTTQVAELKPELSVKEQLTAKDPNYPRGGPHKVHRVKLEAGKTYQIDMSSLTFDRTCFSKTPPASCWRRTTTVAAISMPA